MVRAENIELDDNPWYREQDMETDFKDFRY